MPAGGRIDRGTSLRFTFNGRRYEGHAGDTLASALLANGVTLVARSWKYHRPRGIVGSGVEEPNAIVQLETGARTVPNARATEVELYDGLVARSVNAWPSVDFDLMAAAGLVARLLPAGFYYKTFMWPRRFWMRYEHYIRKASGLGVAPDEPDPDAYDKMNAHCDVLVAGGGPAGLAAAWAAGRAGARVILADEQSEFGGSLLGARDDAANRIDLPSRKSLADAPGGAGPSIHGTIDGAAPSAWVARIVAELRGDARGAAPLAQHGVRLSRPQLPDHRRAAHRSPAAGPASRARASASGACAPRRSCWRPAPSSARWCSRTTTGRGSCSPRRCRPI